MVTELDKKACVEARIPGSPATALRRTATRHPPHTPSKVVEGSGG